MCADTIISVLIKLCLYLSMMILLLFQIALSALFSLSFDDGAVPGVSGKAALFDGFDSRIVMPAAEVPAPGRHFTVDVWVCPVAFPKCPCPVACRQRADAPGGWSLWLDARGKVHFSVASAGVQEAGSISQSTAGKWRGRLSNCPVWNRLSMIFGWAGPRCRLRVSSRIRISLSTVPLTELLTN